MKGRVSLVCLASLILLALLSAPLVAGWTVTYLHSPSYGYDGVALGVSGGQQVGSCQTSDPRAHAKLWTGTAASEVDLNPSGYQASGANGVWGGQQVGAATPAGGEYGHAGLWTGHPDTWVDLHPAGYQSSQATAVWGGQQVGSADISGYPGGPLSRAGLWTGRADTWVDLHPWSEDDPGWYSESWAVGVWGGQQVGGAYGRATANPYYMTHACLWTGTRESWRDLNPLGYDESEALGVWAGQQVGHAWGDATGGNSHAGLWMGWDYTWLDLNPAGCDGSVAYAVSEGRQVGYAWGAATGGHTHASLWTGRPDTWLDLHAYLDPMCEESGASGIEVVGDQVWVVGAAYVSSEYSAVPVLWHYTPDAPVPEPSSLLALGSGVLALCGVIRRRK